MIKVKVTEEFTLKKFDELKNLVRAGKEEEGRLFVKDTFECDEKMADYLTGNNDLKKAVVKVIEVIPELTKDSEAGEIEIKKVELKEKKTTAKNTITRKNDKKKEDK